MNELGRVEIRKLPTGVPGLDEALGGGLPEASFNLIAGEPGTGKTILAHQIVFANASPDRPALYFTLLGEPALKMLRYQQQFTFFDPDRVDGTVRFISLSEVVLSRDLGKLLDSIVRRVQEANPRVVVLDSFRAVERATATAETGQMDMEGFLQRLAVQLTSWEATTFLVGDYVQQREVAGSPLLTVADGILWLFQSVERSSIVRKLQVVKMRGQAPIPGMHTFRITRDGLHVFPRLVGRAEEGERKLSQRRLSTGVAGLDEMMGGGVPEGDAVMVVGPSGSGKSVLGAQFIAEGVRRGEPGIIAVFEEHVGDYLSRAGGFGFDLAGMIHRGQLQLIYLRPLDLSVEETIYEIRQAVDRVGARRVVVDSVSGFELALAASFREDFRESLYRLVGSLTATGITVLITAELVESYAELRFSPHVISFLADDIILQRYVEMEGELRKVVAVVKMRRSQHSKELRAYEITQSGVVVGEALKEYRGIITGVPQRREAPRRPAYPGLTEQETAVMRALIDLRGGSAESVGERTGLGRREVAAALDRLVARDYALKVAERGRTIYRPVAQPVE